MDPSTVGALIASPVSLLIGIFTFVVVALRELPTTGAIYMGQIAKVDISKHKYMRS
jgi:hypothetical protein